MNNADFAQLQRLVEQQMPYADKVSALERFIEAIEEEAFNAGRDSAPKFPGTADIAGRMSALESVMDTTHPGWRLGAHQPACDCAACQ